MGLYVRSLWVVFGLATMVVRPPAASAAKTGGSRLLDRVAARVNNEIITENQILMSAAGDVGGQPSPGIVPDLRGALNALIDERLMAQAAREEIKEIPEEIINNRVEDLVKERRALFPSEQAFLNVLDERGWDLAGYKSYLREQEERVFVVQAALARRVRITEQDVTSYTAELQRRGEPLVYYRLRQILVALPPQPTDQEVRQAETRMLGILEKVRQGVPFEELARRESDDKAARQTGGDLGWIAENSMLPAILEAVRVLDKDQSSRPVRTEKGIHLFQLIRKRTPRDLLWEKRLAEVRETWVEELRRRGQIKILLPALSE